MSRPRVFLLMMSCVAIAVAACGGNSSIADGGTPDAGGEPDASFLTGNCNTDRNRVAQHVESLVDAHRGPCDVDADCAFVERKLPCYDVCPASVLASKAVEARQALVAFGEEVCPHTCRSWADCLPHDKPICHQGYCRHGYEDGGLAF